MTMTVLKLVGVVAAAIAIWFGGYGLGVRHGWDQARHHVDRYGKFPVAPRVVPPHPRHPAGRDWERGNATPLLIALLVGLSILFLSFTFGGPS